jgi:hypothetical protein
MEDLIKALQVFVKYKNQYAPTHCEHDVLCVVDISKEEMSSEDIAAVESLGFFWSDGDDAWQSYRFGSA